MRRDNKAFKERFARWKNGEKVYEHGRPLPKYEDGKQRYVLAESGNPVKFDEQGNLVDQVTGQTGTMYQEGPIVTPKRYDAYGSTYDPKAITDFTGFIPGVGDIEQGFMAKDAFDRGNYLEAGLLGGALLLPNVLEKPLKYVGKKAFPYIMPAMMRAVDNVQNKIEPVTSLFNRTNNRTVDNIISWKDAVNSWAKTDEMRQAAIDYATDPRRETLKQRIFQNAVDKGYIDKSIMQYPEDYTFSTVFKKDEFPTVQLEKLDPWIAGKYRNKPNTVSINVSTKDPDFTNYHEHLHWKGIGDSPSSVFDDDLQTALDAWVDGIIDEKMYNKIKTPIIAKYKGLNDYYKDEIKRALDSPDKYFEKSSEFVVNGLTDGAKAGIKPFSEYPGDDAVIRKLHKNYDKFNLVPYLKVPDSKDFTLKDIWDILSGNYLYGGLGSCYYYNLQKDK